MQDRMAMTHHFAFSLDAELCRPSSQRPGGAHRPWLDFLNEEQPAGNTCIAVNGGAKLVHPGGAKLVHLTLCGTRCWGVVPVVHRRDPRCFV